MTKISNKESQQPSKFGYYVNLNERGSFYADVRNEQGTTVFEVRDGNELGEDESSLVEDGFMRHNEDLEGLQSYLQSLGIIPKDAQLLSMDAFEAL